MSYILEALRKSEYARQQGKVPGLTTVALPLGGTGTEAPARRWGWLAAAIAAAVALGALGALRPWQQVPTEVARSPAQPESSPGAASPSLASPPSTSPPSTFPPLPTPSPVPAAVPAPEAPLATARPVAPLREAPQPAPRPDAKTATPAAPLRTDAPIENAARPQPARPAAPNAPEPAPASPRPDRILAFQELPAPIRSALPVLKVSGFSYADDTEKPMAVINDRLVQEGDEAAPGVTVVRIANDGVVLAYEGFRFRP